MSAGGHNNDTPYVALDRHNADKAYAARERRLARMAVERRSTSDEDMDLLLDMLSLQDA